mgnify:CR=1 FL=1
MKCLNKELAMAWLENHGFTTKAKNILVYSDTLEFTTSKDSNKIEVNVVHLPSGDWSSNVISKADYNLCKKELKS